MIGYGERKDRQKTKQSRGVGHSEDAGADMKSPRAKGHTWES